MQMPTPNPNIQIRTKVSKLVIETYCISLYFFISLTHIFPSYQQHTSPTSLILILSLSLFLVDSDITGNQQQTIGPLNHGMKESMAQEGYIRDSPEASSSSRDMEFRCIYCGSEYDTRKALKKHRKSCRFLHEEKLPNFSQDVVNGGVQRTLAETALRGAIQNVRIRALTDGQTFEEFRADAESVVNDVYTELMDGGHDAHIEAILAVNYHRMRIDENGLHKREEYVAFHYFDAFLHESFDTNEMFNRLEAQIEGFTRLGSGWSVHGIIQLDLNIVARYSLNHIVAGYEYRKSLYMPSNLKKIQACINLRCGKNHPHNECFKDAILCCLHHQQVNQTSKFNRYSYNIYEDNYNWKGVNFPASALDLKRFQKQNPGIYINLFEWSKKGRVRRIQHATVPEGEDGVKGRFINLLCYETGKGMWHYVAVVNIDRLLNSSGSYRRLYCERCLCNFHITKPEKLEEHRRECYGQRPSNTKMPKKGAKIEHVPSAKQEKLPYLVYADIEAYLKPCESMPHKTSHNPIAIGVYRVCNLNTKGKCTALPDEYMSYVGEDCLEKAISKITE